MISRDRSKPLCFAEELSGHCLIAGNSDTHAIAVGGRGLPPAAGQHLPDLICAGDKPAENPVAAGVGDSAFLAGIQNLVVVEIDPDGAAGEPAFAGILYVLPLRSQKTVPAML